MTTIYDVAERAGVSISTVSKTFSGRPYVADSTRRKVLAAAKELGYLPSAAARALAGTRTGLIGVVIFEETDGLFADPVLLELLHGINAELNQHDYMLTLGTVAPSANPVRIYRRLLESYRVDGCLIETTRREEGLQFIIGHKAPCVLLGHTHWPLPHVHPDDRGGAALAARHLLALGHQILGIITGPTGTLAVEARLQGYRDALDQQGIDDNPARIYPGNFRFESGYQGAAHLMDQHPRPTAILAHNDRMALGAIRWLQEHCRRVPEDVSVIGFDDIAQAAQAAPPLTTVRQTPVDIGRRAAQVLLTSLDADHPMAEDGHDIEMPVKLIIRQSTGPAPGS